MTENEREFQKMLGEISLEEKLKLLKLLRTLTEGNEDSQVSTAAGLQSGVITGREARGLGKKKSGVHIQLSGWL